MNELTKDRLREILKEINENNQLKELYHSKWHRIYNFLTNSCNLRISAVSDHGSRSKGTHTRESDLDITFCTSPELRKNEVMTLVLEKAQQAFGRVAKLSRGKNAVHIDFSNPKSNIDVVYLTKQEFNEQHQGMKDVRKNSQVKKDAIKLAKFALDQSKKGLIKHYEVERTALQLDCPSLTDCVYSIIKYFTGRLQQHGKSLESVLKLLK